MAEGEGFEPPLPVRVNMISSHAHSATLPSLRPLIIKHLCMMMFFWNELFATRLLH